MNKLKALVLAVALATGAGAANANITLSSAGVNADIIFIAYDFGAQQTFVLDTNVAYGSIQQPGGTLFSIDLDTLPVWSSFLSTVAGNANRTGIQWTVYSARQNGALLSNTAGTSPGIAASLFGPLRTTSYDAFATDANAVGGADAGALIGTRGGATIGAAGSFALRTSWNVTNLFTPAGSGAVLTNLFDYTSAATATSRLVGNASLDNATGQLTIAAVPEPGTYALMLAGLFTVGAIARRRVRR